MLSVSAQRKLKSRIDCLAQDSLLEAQIPLGPVPRNFLVANVSRKSLTSYRLVTRKSGVSPACYEEVSDFLTISTCQDGLACR